MGFVIEDDLPQDNPATIKGRFVIEDSPQPPGLLQEAVVAPWARFREGLRQVKSAFIPDPEKGESPAFLNRAGRGALGAINTVFPFSATAEVLGQRSLEGLARISGEMSDERLDKRIEFAKQHAPGEVAYFQSLRELPTVEERIATVGQAGARQGAAISGAVPGYGLALGGIKAGARVLRPTPLIKSIDDVAEYAGFQAGVGTKPGFHTYKLKHPITGHPIDSTVSEQTLNEQGFFKPPRPSVPPRPTVAGPQSPEAANAGETVIEQGGQFKKVKDILGELLVSQPHWDEEAKSLVREYHGQRMYAQDQALRLAKHTTKQATNAGVTVKDVGAALKNLPGVDERVQSIAAPIRQRIDENSRTLMDLQLLDRETGEANLNSYLRRTYLVHILGPTHYTPSPDAVQGARTWLSDPAHWAPEGRAPTAEEVEGKIQSILRGTGTLPAHGGRPAIDLGPTMHRQEIPEPIRALMGEVQDGAYAAARTIADQERLLISHRFFEAFAKGVDAPERGGKPWVRDTMAPGYREVPESKRYGALKGRYVQEKYADELLKFGDGVDEAGDAILKYYLETINAFKYAKTVANPPTHIRNTLGNWKFADYMGLPVWNPKAWPHYANAGKALFHQGTDALYRTAMESGVIGTEFSRAELRMLGTELTISDGNPLKAFGRLLHTTLIKWPGRLYDMEDQVFKLAGFSKALESGMSPREATRFVNTWMPNYKEVGTAVKYLRGSVRTPGGAFAATAGAPFSSFQAEALRIEANAARQHPVKFAKWLLMPRIMDEAIMAANGIDREEKNAAFKRLPNPLQQWNTVLWPWRDKNGVVQFIDMTSFDTLGQVKQFDRGAAPSLLPRLADEAMSTSPRMRGAFGVLPELTANALSGFLLNNPIFNTLEQINANQDFFTGRPIVQPEKSATKEMAKFTARQFLPPWTPGIESPIAKQLEAGRTGVSGRYGQKITLPQAVAQEFTGVKPVSADLMMAFQRQIASQAKITELEKREAAVLRNPKLTMAERRTQLRTLNTLKAEAARNTSKYMKLVESVTAPLTAPAATGRYVIED